MLFISIVPFLLSLILAYPTPTLSNCYGGAPFVGVAACTNKIPVDSNYKLNLGNGAQCDRLGCNNI